MRHLFNFLERKTKLELAFRLGFCSRYILLHPYPLTGELLGSLVDAFNAFQEERDRLKTNPFLLGAENETRARAARVQLANRD